MEYSVIFRLTTVTLLALLCHVNAQSEWGYLPENGPLTDEWPATCRKNKQSPINIESSKAEKKFLDDPEKSKIKFEHKCNKLQTITLENSRHAAQLDLHDAGPETCTIISGAGEVFAKSYYLQQFHFHWGSKKKSLGSEHLIDGKKFPLEMHLVLFRSDLAADQVGASTDKDAIVVISVLFEIKEENKEIKPIVDNLQNVTNPATSTEIQANFVKLLPEKTTPFYRYYGSLTTPHCNEIVHWHVLANTNSLSQAQLDKFYSLKMASAEDPNTLVPMLNNFRPPQKLNKRVVELVGPEGFTVPVYDADNSAISLLLGGVRSLNIVVATFLITFLLFT